MLDSCCRFVLVSVLELDGCEHAKGAVNKRHGSSSVEYADGGHQDKAAITAPVGRRGNPDVTTFGGAGVERRPRCASAPGRAGCAHVPGRYRSQ